VRQVISRKPTDYHGSNGWFDRSVARRLRKLEPRLFVGVETCALESIHAAKKMGVPALLDCPGIPSGLLLRELNLMADELKIPCEAPSFSGRAEARKREERLAADHLLLCSDLQREWYASEGIPPEKMSVNPLWVDSAFAGSRAGRVRSERGPLRVLFVGHATAAKGAPYLIQAMKGIDLGCRGRNWPPFMTGMMCLFFPHWEIRLVLWHSKRWLAASLLSQLPMLALRCPSIVGGFLFVMPMLWPQRSPIMPRTGADGRVTASWPRVLPGHSPQSSIGCERQRFFSRFFRGDAGLNSRNK
jgi:hypothetical protein